MTQTAVVDPRPLDYRDQRIAGIAVADDLRTALGVNDDSTVRITTERGREVLCQVIGGDESVDGGTVRIDRFTRQALKAFPHERVELRSVPAAGTVSELGLIPGVELSQQSDGSLVPALKRALVEQHVAVRPGMLLYVKLGDGLGGITYDVHTVTAGGGADEGVVDERTTIWMIDPDHDHHGPSDHDHHHDGAAETVLDTTFEDIGGLTPQIREVREFVELPLVFPQVYRQLGINPPRGVIFYGAPGTGKTLLARSVANEINAQLFTVNGPEVVGTYSGETEANLRKLFTEASLKPPSIIFIDELDAIAPFRRTATNQSDARAVTQLLALMDGLENAEGVIVIGTTNRVQAIDPALRRAGRFDREIYFPTPGKEEREQILRVQTREMPLDDRALEELPAVAERAYGYVGADLMELSREAGLNALRRAAVRFVESPSIANYPAPEELVVRRHDLEVALDRVQPSAMRESLLVYPSITWEDIGGLDRIKSRLRDLVEQPLRHPEAFERAGLARNLGVLLHGPPGTGKTLLAQAIARASGVNFIPIHGPELFSQWLGESEETVRHLFDVASRTAPSILFFDQLDAVLPKRSDLEHEGTRAPQRVVNQLLAELDGIQARGEVLVLGATNRLSMVDPAALRPGRFGVHLHVEPPDLAERAEILRIHLAGSNIEGDRDALIAEAAARSEHFVGAQLAALCQEAKLAALSDVGFDGDPDIGMQHLELALEELSHEGP